MTIEERLEALEARAERLTEVLTIVVGLDQKLTANVVIQSTGKPPDPRELVNVRAQRIKELVESGTWRASP